MQSVMFDDIRGNWISDNLIHNRINTSWFPSESVTLTMQMRNRFMYGETIKYSPGYAENIDRENGFMDLSVNILNENSFFLNAAIDRIYLQVTSGKLVTTVGRQRINWGISSVWNPNDLFNVQNYFDFDYIEQPGSDAIRMQYYTGASSSAELALKVDRNKKITSAALYRFTTGSYDFQILAGMLSGEDLVTGLGWSGDIEKIGFKGEATYLHPFRNFRDTSGVLLVSVGGDYMFSNSMFLQFEALYSKMPAGRSIANFLSWYQETLTVKNLSFTDVSLFGSFSYPVSPLLNINIAGMYFPKLKGFFAGPGLDYSLSDNMQFSMISQFFSGEFPDILTQKNERTNLFLGFIRYRLNF